MENKILNDPVYKAFHKALHYFLQTEWLKKQTELGAQSGVSKGMMSDAVNGIKKLAFDKREKIAEKCHLSYESFIKLGISIFLSFQCRVVYGSTLFAGNGLQG